MFGFADIFEFFRTSAAPRSFSLPKFRISGRKRNQIRKYFNPFVSSPGRFGWVIKLMVENLVDCPFKYRIYICTMYIVHYCEMERYAGGNEDDIGWLYEAQYWAWEEPDISERWKIRNLLDFLPPLLISSNKWGNIYCIYITFRHLSFTNLSFM